MDRRAFLTSGGAAALGLALPSLRLVRPAGPIVRMWSDPTGARVGFDPVGLAVAPGTAIRWILESGVHSTTAYHADLHDRPTRIPAGATPWDSGIRAEPGLVLETTLEVPGVYDAYCLPHEAAGMVVRIVVGRPGRDFDLRAAGPSVGPTGETGLPPLALAAFPEPERIVREGVVRLRRENPPERRVS